MKNNQFKQHFATTYRRLTKKTTAFVYQSTCLVHFTLLAPTSNIWSNQKLQILFLNGKSKCGWILERMWMRIQQWVQNITELT